MYLYEWRSARLNNRRKIIVLVCGEVALKSGRKILIHLLKKAHDLGDERFVDQLLEFEETVGLLGGAEFVGLLEIAVFKLDGQAGVGFENGDLEDGMVEVA